MKYRIMQTFVKQQTYQKEPNPKWEALTPIQRFINDHLLPDHRKIYKIEVKVKTIDSPRYFVEVKKSDEEEWGNYEDYLGGTQYYESIQEAEAQLQALRYSITQLEDFRSKLEPKMCVEVDDDGGISYGKDYYPEKE